MTKRIKIFIILALLITTNLFLLFYFNYLNAEIAQMHISNRLYSTWHLELQYPDVSADEVKEHLSNNSRIFIVHDDRGNIRTLHQRGRWIPPLIEGEYFSAETGMLQALVGANVRHELENESYFVINEVTYEVVGVLGAGFPSSLDYLVLLNYAEQSLPITQIIVDSDYPNVLRNLANVFYTQDEIERRGIERFFEKNIFQQLIRINVTIISIFLAILIGYSHFSIFKKSSYVRHLFGESKLKILVSQLLTLTIIYLISIVGVQLVDLFMGAQVVWQRTQFYLLIWLGVSGSFIMTHLLAAKRNFG